MTALLFINCETGDVHRYERGAGKKVLKTNEAVITKDFDANIGMKGLQTFLKSPHLLDLIDAPKESA